MGVDTLMELKRMSTDWIFTSGRSEAKASRTRTALAARALKMSRPLFSFSGPSSICMFSGVSLPPTCNSRMWSTWHWLLIARVGSKLVVVSTLEGSALPAFVALTACSHLVS